MKKRIETPYVYRVCLRKKGVRKNDGVQCGGMLGNPTRTTVNWILNDHVRQERQGAVRSDRSLVGQYIEIQYRLDEGTPLKTAKRKL